MSEVTFSGNTIGDKAIYLTGVARGEKNEQERILKLLADAEWHEESKDYSQTDTDLKHIPEYCFGCQLQERIKEEQDECSCIPCDNTECDCRTKRCGNCKEKDN